MPPEGREDGLYATQRRGTVGNLAGWLTRRLRGSEGADLGEGASEVMVKKCSTSRT